jgi:hypothetical protein
MAVLAVLEIIGMILLCLIPVAVVGALAIWSHWENTQK